MIMVYKSNGVKYDICRDWIGSLPGGGVLVEGGGCVVDGRFY